MIAICVSVFSQETGIVFRKDSTLEQALKTSKEEGKYLFIDCYTTYCGPCKRMEKNVFPQKGVGDFYNKNFINIRIEMQTHAGIEIKKKYKVEGYPTLLYLDSDGEVLNRLCGGIDSDLFIKTGKLALDTINNNRACKKRIEEGVLNANVLENYFRSENETNDSLLNKYFNSITDKEKVSSDNFWLFTWHSDNIELPYFKFFYEHIDEYIDKYGYSDMYWGLRLIYERYLANNLLDTIKIRQLVSKDSIFYRRILKELDYISACQKFNNDKTSIDGWNNLIIKIKDCLSNCKEVNFIHHTACWSIIENYKTFNDTSALKYAKDIAYKLFLSDPKNPEYNNTYAIILFKSGNVKDAIKHEEIALKEFQDKNNLFRKYRPEDLLDDYVEYYNTQLDSFKKGLN